MIKEIVQRVSHRPLHTKAPVSITNAGLPRTKSEMALENDEQGLKINK